MLQIPTTNQLNQSLDQHQWPVFDAVQAQPSAIDFTLKVTDSLEYFAGHFPQHAVLPGVVQIHWAIELARQCFAASGFSEAKNIKFITPIEPNNVIQLTLRQTVNDGDIEFSYHSQQCRYSSGRIAFANLAVNMSRSG